MVEANCLLTKFVTSQILYVLTDQNKKNYDVTRVTRRVPHVEREALIPPDHLSSPLIFSGVGVALSLVFCVMFYRSSFVHLFFFFWPLYCLSFFDFRFLLVFQTFFMPV